MKILTLVNSVVLLLISIFGCIQNSNVEIPEANIQPRIITESVKHDTDDPAIWIHPEDISKSLIIGTDKHKDGALYAFDLQGKIVKVYRNLARPNNVDVAYGFPFYGDRIDIAVVTERLEQRIRIFKLPELEPIDAGNLVVFDGNTDRAPMGIAVYNRPTDNLFFVIVSGKSGPEKGYLGQYLLESDDQDNIHMTEIRHFGNYSGEKEIEAIAVDEELGYVYYSDETVGVRKYHADPDHPEADNELALFATEGFALDHEGISIYKKTGTTGYLLVSDQQANRFWVFPREGTLEDPHQHNPMKIINSATLLSDGNEVTSTPLPGFQKGLFVAMSDDKTFQYYSCEDFEGTDLK